MANSFLVVAVISAGFILGYCLMYTLLVYNFNKINLNQRSNWLARYAKLQEEQKAYVEKVKGLSK